MLRKTFAAIAAAAALLCIAGPVSAETFTAENGVLSIDLPNENWKEITDPTTWIALSDGGNMITIDHYSNGEKLPDIKVADDHYVNVYQAVFSTQNEVFIITGSVVDAAKIPEVANAIVSAKVLRYDTKKAVQKETEASAVDFAIVPMDKTMYVTSDGLNVRMGSSTSEQIIGAYPYAAAVKVTGQVIWNGQDYGWYQIAYGGGTGYVSSSFLSDTQPETKESTEEKKNDETAYTGTVKTVYDEMGTVYTLYEGTDGFWRDREGTAYTRVSDIEFQVYEGMKRLSIYSPVNEESSETGSSVTVYDEYGASYTLYEGTDGFWRDREGTAYSWINDTDLKVYEGNKVVSVNYPDYSDQENDYDYSDQEMDDYDYSDQEISDDDEDGYDFDEGVITAYAEDGTAVTLYQDTMGIWRDGGGTEYTRVSDTEFKVVDGNKYLTVY